MINVNNNMEEINFTFESSHKSMRLDCDVLRLEPIAEAPQKSYLSIFTLQNWLETLPTIEF